MIARDPVSCQKGDLFCRECALANILAQKKELKRTEKIRKAAEEDTAKTKAAQDEEDQERAVKDFELTQAGFSSAKRKQIAETAPEDEAAGTKRKFTLDEDEIERIARQDRTKARKAIEDEKVSIPSVHEDFVSCILTVIGQQSHSTIILDAISHAIDRSQPCHHFKKAQDRSDMSCLCGIEYAYILFTKAHHSTLQ